MNNSHDDAMINDKLRLCRRQHGEQKTLSRNHLLPYNITRTPTNFKAAIDIISRQDVKVVGFSILMLLPELFFRREFNQVCLICLSLSPPTIINPNQAGKYSKTNQYDNVATLYLCNQLSFFLELFSPTC